MKKSLFVVLSVLTFVSTASAADLTPSVGKKSGEPLVFKSAEEYDKEAAVRVENFTLPDDVSASLFVDPSQTQNPTAICFDHKGRLYIAEAHRWRAGVQDIRNEQQILLDDIDNTSSQDRFEMYERDQLTRPLSFYEEFSDRIVRAEDTTGDGRADSATIWADDFDEVLDGPGIGLVAGPGDTIYYTNIPNVWKLTDTNGDGKADDREILQDGFGVRMSISGHDMHGIVWGPDGRLYWSIGDRGYNFTTKEGRHLNRPFTGAVFRCDPDGSNLEEVYSGLRNPQELAFDKYGNLFTCDNDADQWDKGRLVYILEGGDTGWNHGHQVLLNFRNQLNLRTPDYAHPDHKTIPLNAWLTEGLWETLHDERPAFALPPIDSVSWGPSGMVYNYGVTTMPERYADHFWVCNFGGAKGDLEAFSVKSEGAGFALDQHEIFMVGLGNTDVEFGPDGRMYLSCFNNNGWYKEDIGNIYALESNDVADTGLLADTQRLLTTDFSTFVENELVPLLSHPDMRVRMRAQFDLVRRGSANILIAAIQENDDQLARLHGIWGLGQLARKDEALLSNFIGLLEDSDSEVRAQAVKVLSDSRTVDAGDALVASLDDPSARVRSFAAIGVGKCGHTNALPKLYEMLAANDNKDVFLRHAIVQGMWYLNEREKILKETGNESAAVRMAVLLTLRKLQDPRVKYFLSDSEESIRNEAIRAINDLDLVTALPDLADEIIPYAEAAEGIELPEGHRDWIIQTRLINANFRVGEPENAMNLLAYAAEPSLPEILREQALRAIIEWPTPSPVDSTTGQYRPIDPETRPDISKSIKSGLPAVFEHAKGNLIGLSTEIALSCGVEAPVELLTTQITDEDAGLDARIKSLEGLAKQDAEALTPLWDGLLRSKDPVFRAAVIGQLILINRNRGLAEAVKMARSQDLKTRQQGYRLLGPIEDPAVVAIFSAQLAQIKKEKAGALLDLLESAAQQKDTKVVEALAAYNASLDAGDPLAAFRPTLKGGNVARGKEIFVTHAIGQCAKCHKVDGDGGVAGPELTGIGTRNDSEYILESLVSPSSVVVPGYGLTMVSLNNGESIGGALLKENANAITLKLPDPEDSLKTIEKTIPLDEIASRQPPISAMPPVGLAMTKSEVRDLVAYLSSLKEKKEK